MAKNVARKLAVKKKQKLTKSRTEAYIINRKYYGDEPVIEPGTIISNDGSSQYTRLLNWYNRMCDRSDARDYLEEYLANSDLLQEYKKISNRCVPYTAAWVARLIDRGAIVQGGELFIEKKIRAAAALSTRDDGSDDEDEEGAEEKPKAPKVRREQSIHHYLNPVFDSIQGWLRGDIDLNLYEYLKGQNFPLGRVEMLLNEYLPMIEEAERAIKGNKVDLEYVTARWGKKPREVLGLLKRLVEDLERYKGSSKTVKKQRAKKPVSVEKKLARFRYMKESNELRAASIDPGKVIGAQVLWTYNTRYDVINVFRAKDAAGLDVDGIRVANYDPDTSVCRRVGRAREKVIKDVLTLGRVPLRKYMDEIKSSKVVPANDRFTDQILILRAEKTG